MERLLITGASGFVGGAVLPRAVARGYQVVAYVLPGERLSTEQDLERVEVVYGDVGDLRALKRAMRGVELCLHIAGNTSFYECDRGALVAVNVDGVHNVLRAAREEGVRRLVHTSSVAAVGYDPSGHPVDEKQRYNWPVGMPYMETKRDGERAALAASTDLEVVVLNPATVLGPGGGSPADRQLMAAISAGAGIIAPPGGMTICDIDDVAEAHMAALERGRSGQRYILGGPHLTHRELFSGLAEIFNSAKPALDLPPWLLAAAGRVLWRLERDLGWRTTIPGSALRVGAWKLYYASDKAERELGYRSRSAETIIRRTAV